MEPLGIKTITLILNIIWIMGKRRQANIMHYEYTPMQYTAIFHGCKNDNVQFKLFDYFHIFAKNIDCGYTLNVCFRVKTRVGPMVL